MSYRIKKLPTQQKKETDRPQKTPSANSVLAKCGGKVISTTIFSYLHTQNELKMWLYFPRTSPILVRYMLCYLKSVLKNKISEN